MAILRNSDCALAASCQFSDDWFHVKRTKRLTDREIYDHCYGEVGRLGLTIAFKQSTHLRLSKWSTTYYRQIRLGTNFLKMTLPQKAALLAHELVHARQWRHFGRLQFGAGYLRASFRWAVEVQAYSETVRVHTLLGIDTTGYIERRPGVMRGIYMLDRLPREMDMLTKRYLSCAAEETRALLPA